MTSRTKPVLLLSLLLAAFGAGILAGCGDSEPETNEGVSIPAPPPPGPPGD